MHDFMWGSLVALSLVIGLFFLRYWYRSRDRLYAFFSLAFVLLAGSWAWIATASPAVETRHYAYVLRLLAFALIIVSVVDKNRRARAEAKPSESRAPRDPV